MTAKNFTRSIGLFWIFLLGIWSPTVGAAVVGPGSTVRVDFDFGAYFPVTQYYNIQAGFVFGPSNLLDTGEGWTVRMYDNENGPALDAFSFTSSFSSTNNIYMQVYGNQPTGPFYGKGFLLLTDIYGSFDLTNVTFSGNDGQGYTFDINGTITAVPVPGGLWLLLSGLSALSFLWTRKSRSTNQFHYQGEH